MDRLLYLITRGYHSMKPFIKRLELRANKLNNTKRFHKKYGRGANCGITDCECKK